MPDAPAAPESLSTRSRAARAAALASSGLLVGFGATAASPALAATSDDCEPGNTVDAATGDATDIQTLLDADTAIVCLSGTFSLTAPLTFDHDLTLFGLSAAELDGNDLTNLVVGSSSADLTVQNITFRDGTALEGGAIWSNGALLVEGSTFIGNTAGDFGGAIFNESGGYDVEIVDSVFTGNSAGFAGGAAYGEVLLIETSTFTDNNAEIGGAAYGAIVGAFESTFTDNVAIGGGAIASDLYGAVFGSTFVDNQAEVVGGAVMSYGAIIGVNSTFLENEAGEVGGAIFTEYGEIGLSTFIENRADSVVSGDYSEAIFSVGDEDQLTLIGNILAGSRSNSQVGSASEDGYSDAGGNVFSTTLAQEPALGIPHPSTQFGRTVASVVGTAPAAEDNGGSTPTIALVPGSPAIDAVPDEVLDALFTSTSSALAPAAERFGEPSAAFIAAVTDATTDQRNVERTGLTDAGSFEFGDAELAATGADSGVTGWLAGAAALLVGLGVTAVAVTRRTRGR